MLLVLAALLPACATDVAANSTPATLTPIDATGAARDVELTAEAYVPLRHGYRLRRLRPGDRFAPVGRIDEGAVYRSAAGDLMAITGNAYEAHIVVRDDRIVGVFLPVEEVFVNAVDPPPIQLQEVAP
jgi:hypothetical protein